MCPCSLTVAARQFFLLLPLVIIYSFHVTALPLLALQSSPHPLQLITQQVQVHKPLRQAGVACSGSPLVPTVLRWVGGTHSSQSPSPSKVQVSFLPSRPYQPYPTGHCFDDVARRTGGRTHTQLAGNQAWKKPWRGCWFAWWCGLLRQRLSPSIIVRTWYCYFLRLKCGLCIVLL